MKLKSLSLLVPTRGRGDSLLPRFWASLLDTVSDWSRLQIVHRIDDDDPETANYLNRISPTPTIIVKPRPDGGYKSLATLYNEMSARATGDLLMCGNDDMIFRSHGWVEQYLDAANHYRDGIFNLGCYTYPTSAVPFSVVSRQAVDRIGFLNDERLIYSDIFLRDVFARFGRVRFLPSIVVEHTAPEVNDEAMAVKQALHEQAAEYWPFHYRCVDEAAARLKAVA